MAATKKKTGEIYVAKQSFTTELSDGTPVTISRGHTRVREGHELLARCPEYFEVMSVHYDVEDASADPGVKRGE